MHLYKLNFELLVLLFQNLLLLPILLTKLADQNLKVLDELLLAGDAGDMAVALLLNDAVLFDAQLQLVLQVHVLPLVLFEVLLQLSILDVLDLRLGSLYLRWSCPELFKLLLQDAHLLKSVVCWSDLLPLRQILALSDLLRGSHVSRRSHRLA